MNLSYTTEYFPNLDELTQTQKDASRAFVVQKLREKFADVDLSPGTVTGDQVVAPLSEFIAAADLAFSRFMSDLDLGNAAEGVIYSCPFVAGFLGNFSVYDDSNLQSVGVVRLTFSEDPTEPIKFARNVAFKFGSDDTYRIRFTSEHGEYFEVLPTSAVSTIEDDKMVLVQTSSNSWSIDVPVYGAMISEVTSGSAGTINKVYANLTGISAVTDFIRGSTPTSLPELARMARRIYHSMSASSRHGIRATIYHHWPETVMASPIMPNDLEMRRGNPGSALGLPDVGVDIYFRSVRDLFPQRQLVKLTYTTSASDNSVDDLQRFRGKIPFLHSPSKILSVKAVGVTDPDAIVSTTIYSRATGITMPYGMHFGTRYEEFYIDVNPKLVGSGAGTPVITLMSTYSETGDAIVEKYAMFEIEYEADPLLKAVSAHLESPDQAAAGVHTIVHAGPLVDVDTMTIYYHRRPGVQMLLNPAIAKIVEYAKTSGYPEVFTPSSIHDIMRVAGASMVASITVTGSVRATPADRWMHYNPTFGMPASLDADWYRSSFELFTKPVSSVAEMSPEVVRTDSLRNGAGGNQQNLVTVMTKRTVRYRVEPTGINFVELA